MHTYPQYLRKKTSVGNMLKIVYFLEHNLCNLLQALVHETAFE